MVLEPWQLSPGTPGPGRPSGPTKCFKPLVLDLGPLNTLGPPNGLKHLAPVELGLARARLLVAAGAFWWPLVTISGFWWLLVSSVAFW